MITLFKKGSRVTILLLGFFLFYFTVIPLTVASIASGTIDLTYKYAWSENTGWLNFRPVAEGTTVTDSGLTGYAWSEHFGWILLNPTSSGVVNDGYGNLSGQAWGEKVGWIDFDGVTIDGAGYFTGYASGSITGRISLNCSNTSSCSSSDFKVRTDWRPRGERAVCNNALDDDGDGKIDYPNDPGCTSSEHDNETDPPPAGGGGSGGNPDKKVANPSSIIDSTVIIEGAEDEVGPENPSNEEQNSNNKSVSLIDRIKIFIEPLLPDFLKPDSESPSPEEYVTVETPVSMRGAWELLPRQSLEEFVLAPLPERVRFFAESFPDLNYALTQAGVINYRDLDRLKGKVFKLPGISKAAGIYNTWTTLGQLSESDKEKIPHGVVFARVGDSYDLDSSLYLEKTGELRQEIVVTPGKPLQFLYKTRGDADSVRGYIVFRSFGERAAAKYGGRQNLMASLFFSNNISAKVVNEPIDEGREVVLAEFEYTDADGDGLYTAEVESPLIDGDYEVLTVVDYSDDERQSEIIRLVAVVDPEGYVFERVRDQELRVNEAKVYLYNKDESTGVFELWPAEKYLQNNPQTTDRTGEYSFLVPEGVYVIKVEAQGYEPYQSAEFSLQRGRGVHENIELKRSLSFASLFDWKMGLLTLFLLVFIVYVVRVRIQKI